ncbi:diguanylate cyclase domain-containing protein [Nocardioides sp. Kera G14]|uniref:diguanylate cyclase domain-containing protein n=1 Tax=Nocardioides sp. Kera G14 TaxID=2884264 RepID=UPI001D0F5753|nr:diguanylate cyclase [Nocardioides sp. Kera G14]UDY25161.1 diguanylate cyclase [Nocardioides sp. Kera G14]
MAVGVVAVVYGLTTTQRHDDRPNRLAAASFLATFVGAGVAPTIGTLGSLASRSDAGTVSTVLMTMGVTAGAALLWNASQCFATRPPLLGFTAMAATLASAVALVVSLTAPRWDLLPAAVVAGLVHAFAAVELRRSPSASNLNSILLETVMWADSGAGVVLAVLSGADRIGHDAAWAAFLTVIAAGSLSAALALTALRVERYGNWWTLGDEQDRIELGVHEANVFVEEAADRLERCQTAGQPVHFMTASLPGLVELNTAYGHLAGDAALRWVAEILRRQAPPSAVLGHLGAGRFAIVTSRDPELIANAVQTGMMRVPPPASLPVRLTPVFSWASSDEAGYDLDVMRVTAEERLANVS